MPGEYEKQVQPVQDLFVSSENTEEASSFSDAGVVPYLLISDSQDQLVLRMGIGR